MEDKFSIIEASAGSGKTYSLAVRYLNILSGIRDEKFISSIVAITFTNKAATEMKERIIAFLKSLGEIDKTVSVNRKDLHISRNKVVRLLVSIVKNYDDFNIMTIDSFMNRIMRAFAFDLQINPNYEISFRSDEIFDIAFENMILDKKLEKKLLDFLKVRLSYGDNGMDGVAIISKALKKLALLDLKTCENTVSDDEILNWLKSKVGKTRNMFDDIEKRKKEIFEKLKELAEEMKNKDCFKGNKVRSGGFLFNFETAFKNIDRFKHICKEGVYELLKSDALEKGCETKKIKELACELFDAYVMGEIYSNYKVLNSTLEILREWEENRKKVEEYFNVIDGKTIVDRIMRVLNSDKGVSYAFLRLGEKVNHYLIDEFQDTSKEQFKAMEPLIENALSEGGSLFVVGDRKQAIYAWRGGDYRIFDSIKRYSFPISPIISKLDYNYRSSKNIVEFNNRVFNPEKLPRKEIEKVFKECNKSKIILREIKNVYSNVRQNGIKKEEGFVKVILKEEPRDGFDRDEFYKRELIAVLKEFFDKGVDPNKVMILLRRKEDIKKVVLWISEEFEGVNILTEDSLILTQNFAVKKLLTLISVLIYDGDDGYKKASEEWFGCIDFEEIANKTKGFSLYELAVFLLSEFDFDYENNKLYIDTLLEEILKRLNEGRSSEEIIEDIYENPATVVLPENVGALRVMTIHKSKGLQAHTVIVPFYDWRIYDSKKEIFDCIYVREFKNFMFADVFKLKGVVKDAKRIYCEKLKVDFIEALNLMYVANTRAQSNLAIIGLYRMNKEKQIKKMPKNITASNILREVLKDDMREFEEHESFEIGKIETFGESSIERESIELSSRIFFNIRDRLRIDPVLDIYESQKDKRIGDLFHTAISFIDTVGEDVDKCLEGAYRKAVNLLGYEEKDVLRLLKNTVEDLALYFKGFDRCFNEKEFVNKKGEIVRPDRIVVKDNNIFVIEYKTGAEKEEHEWQLRRYMNLFKNAKGILYYCRNRRSKILCL
ncbi:UvrD-helicase domain-containing protein [Hippea alviniae]|uniref:UvrD-helicase domain-containing protein n=1 Tax=Hippea alviniae TaxID=1279027 RepID=UPI0003B37BBC|nr:UvrD-helicase domain-containing protein [Hippea alviniae]